jgi:transaldolase
MKIFLDTAELDEIKQAFSWGLIDGVTTNPSLIRKAVERRGSCLKMEDYIIEILKTVPGPVSLEVIAQKSDEMIEQARLLYKKFSPYGEVVVKIPVNSSVGDDDLDFEGLKAIKHLSKEGVPTNCTLVMTPEQALLAAKAGATYVSPFAGRIDDYIRAKMGMKIGVDFKKEDYFDHELLKAAREAKFEETVRSFKYVPEAYRSSEIRSLVDQSQDNGILSSVDLVARILRIYRNYGYKTQVIAASIRNSRQVREVAELGVDIATLPFYVVKEMIRHYKTAEGIRAFIADVVPEYEEIFRQK